MLKWPLQRLSELHFGHFGDMKVTTWITSSTFDCNVNHRDVPMEWFKYPPKQGPTSNQNKGLQRVLGILYKLDIYCLIVNYVFYDYLYSFFVNQFWIQNSLSQQFTQGYMFLLVNGLKFRRLTVPEKDGHIKVIVYMYIHILCITVYIYSYRFIYIYIHHIHLYIYHIYIYIFIFIYTSYIQALITTNFTFTDGTSPGWVAQWSEADSYWGRPVLPHASMLVGSGKLTYQ